MDSIMKKVFIAISILLLSSGSKLAAQTITDSNDAYREFVQLANKDEDKSQMYDALYRCYTATYAIITHSEKTSAEYSQAMANMKNIIAFLPNAAAYNSNNQSTGNAIKFARAYVDVVGLSDFADGGYTSQNAYSQLSYFAAANLVNRRQYEEAIPYLQAYLRSGDRSTVNRYSSTSSRLAHNPINISLPSSLSSRHLITILPTMTSFRRQ